MQAFTKIEIVIVTLHPFGCCSTIKICFPYLSAWKPLCCLTSLAFITLFSFQGAASSEQTPLAPFPASAENFVLLCCSSSSNFKRFAALKFDLETFSSLFWSQISKSNFIGLWNPTANHCLVGPSGLEPPTLRLSVARSSQLSYGPVPPRGVYPLN